MIRKLFLKIKRWWFRKITGFYPEDIKRLIYVQKYLEHNKHRGIKTYNEYIKEHFNGK